MVKGGGQVATTINLRDVPEDLHLRAKVQATKEGLSLKALVIRLLEEYLKKVGG
jgi:predicted HicB family RNase H-like nuclease